MKELALPPRVRPGDAVALVSPSWFGAGAFPHRVGRGRACLESLGLRLKVMPNALAMGDWTAGTPGQRADDLHAAFADSEAAVVLCAIGGNHSNDLLDLLDFDFIRARPKVFQGLSDITVLHCALHRHAGLATFQSTCTRAWRWMGVAAFRRDGKPHLRWLPRIALLACQGVARVAGSRRLRAAARTVGGSAVAC